MVLDRKIAFINLTDRSIEIKPIPLDLRKKFLGGRGINMYLLSKSYSSELDPFSPENPLILGAGLLTGTPGFGPRMNITAKSPESGHLGDANVGGDFGAELVRAGFGHLVITGRSTNPIYLFIKNTEKDDLETSLNTPVLCRQCKEMKCLEGDDLATDRAKNSFVWNRIHAGRYPFDALSVLEEKSYHCDLCGGDPQCVKVCTPKAIRITQ